MVNSNIKRVICFLAASAVCFAAMDRQDTSVLADSISELEAEMAANSRQISEKKSLMQELSAQSDSAKAYLSALSDKMDLQQENIDIINRQLDELEADIADKETEIAALEVKIGEKKAEIDENIEIFRERLRSMYISGNDSTASILTGAADFYDLLARYEFISRVAENDDDLIEGLNIQLEDYSIRTEELGTRKAELEIQKKNAEGKRDVLIGEMNAFIDEFDESQRILSEISQDEELAASDIEWLNSRNSELSERIEEIKEQERAAAEQARREAEERRRRQDEARRRQEEESRRQEEERRREAEAERIRAEEAEEDRLEAEEFAAWQDDEDEYYQGYEEDYDLGYDDYNDYDGFESYESYESYSSFEEDIPQVNTSPEYYESREDVIDYAKTYLGIYYQWCGNYPAEGYYGLDCSHFTYRVLQHFGLMDSYMDSRGQCSYCTSISESELMPGDLVFYQNSSGRVEHVTMYIGNGQIIGAQGGDSWVSTKSSAESINAKVKIVSLYSDGRYKTYGRVPGMY